MFKWSRENIDITNNSLSHDNITMLTHMFDRNSLATLPIKACVFVAPHPFVLTCALCLQTAIKTDTLSYMMEHSCIPIRIEKLSDEVRDA